MKSKLKNRILSWLVAAVLIVGLLPVISVPAMAADITFSGGNGTSTTPWLISTAAQLESLASEVNANNTTYNAAYYKLMNDIDLSGYANWTPIGSYIPSTAKFYGNFDGNGFAVKNMTIHNTTADMRVGLFGLVSGGTIKNLGVINADIATTEGYAGIIASMINNNATISNCYTTGRIAGINYVGGVAGMVYGTSDVGSTSLETCYSTATVSGTDYVGGISGSLAVSAAQSRSASLTNCYATGAVSGANYVGGIVGRAGNGTSLTTFSGCAALNPSVTGTGTNVGRVTGDTANGTCNKLYGFSGTTVKGATVSGSANDMHGANTTAASITGESTSIWNTMGWPGAYWTAGNLTQLKTTGGVVINGQDGAIPAHIMGFSGGSGTSGYPYQISTAAELASLASKVNAGAVAYNAAYYKLMNDISISSYNWTPIGISSTYPFKGTFDGGGHTINGLTITGAQTITYIGLFGYSNNAVIKNLGVTGANINTTHTVAINVGALAGQIAGTTVLTNCYTTGSVTGTATGSVTTSVGGFAGYTNVGTTVRNCYSTCNVSTNSGNLAQAGGFIGYLIGNVENCYAAGSVSATGATTRYGRFSGSNYSNTTTKNCYSPVGMSVGNNMGVGSNNGTITGGGTATATQAFADTLNANRSTNTEWSEWAYIAGKNGGYPIFGVTYTVTLHGDDGSGGPLSSYTYGTGAILPSDWTKSGYTFGGWYDNAECSGDPITNITANDEGNKEYWAKWTLITKVTEINDNTSESGFAITSSNLDAVFDRVVTQTDTADDNIITLSLNVSDIGSQTTETDAIKQAADKGSEVYFFDVTLTKQINNDAPTTLTNIPVPVEVHIQLTGDLAGKSYYKVYRYHNGVAEQISNDTTKTEHYKVDIENSEIVIYTMKFSTYAIFGNDISLQDLTNGEDMDVQAKITDASLGVYKVDIAWGAMTFEWNASGQEWNPDTHAYDPIPGNGVWTDASHNGENNRIVCANHSNGSLLATFDVSGTLGGVTYDVFTDNDVKDTAATDMSLPKVPNETATAPEIRAYLWLTGEPDGTAMAALSNIWQKVGVITITFTPDIGDTDKTPKN